jgi:drug/metabolite transporter (DMT)-like permease
MAGLTFASLNVVNKAVLERHGPADVLAVNLLWGGVPLLPLGLPTALRAPWGAVSAATWAAIAYTVVVPVFLGHQVWNWAVTRVGVGRTIAYANLTPVLAGTLSALIFAETFDVPKLLGAAACLGGLVLPAGRAAGRAAEPSPSPAPADRSPGLPAPRP